MKIEKRNVPRPSAVFLLSLTSACYFFCWLVGMYCDPHILVIMQRLAAGLFQSETFICFILIFAE